MNATQLIAIVELTICLIFLILLFMKLVPIYRLDSFRQTMFKVRDELFDYAADGHISFNDPAYKLLRQSMNGYIRYAHQITFFRLCCTFFIWKYTEQARPFKWTEAWDKAFANINNPEVQDKITEFHLRSINLVMLRIVIGSPILLIAMPIVLLGILAKRQWKNLKEAWVSSISEVVSKFFDPRILEEEAAATAAP